MIKVAGQNDLPEVESIMRRIHDEDPSYWPYGLDASQFNGGLYMVQKEASDKPVGFVGWQEFPERGRNIGYYAIGILPEHREQSFAKQAVTQALREMGGRCDEVRAMVMAHNEPSKALARSVNIPMIEKLATEKSATTKADLAKILATGLGSAAFFDQTADPSRSVGSSLQPWTWDKDRLLMGGLNALLGGLGGQRMTKGEFGQGLGAIALAPTKDLAIKGVGSLHKIDDAAKKFTETEGDTGGIPKEVLLGAGGLGLGALGLLAYNAKRKADLREKALDQESKGRVKITLPTTNPGDNETEVLLPIEDMQFSKALHARLRRDTKRRLNAETLGRTRRRSKRDKPPVEEKSVLGKAAALQELVGEIEFYKQAIGPAAAPQNAVPTPPQLGQNPAIRMNQQDQAVAQAIEPATDANPAIMEAEQAAMQAEQAGAQQAAQVEQQAQQAQMEMTQQFQEQMMKSEQEKEVLKLQLEKEKALKELNDAKAKAEGDAAAGEGTEAQKLVGNRIGRLSKRVGSIGGSMSKGGSTNPVSPGTPGTLDPKTGQVIPAPPPPKTPLPPRPTPQMPEGTPGFLDPKTGQPIPEGPIHLKPHAADMLNDHPGATGVIPNIGVYRHSYGPMLDTVYGLFRQRLLTPDAPPRAQISRSSMLNTPDKLGLISQVLSRGASPGAMDPRFGPLSAFG